MILVTGATGFIGANLVDKLVKKGYNVTCLVRKTSNVSKLDHPKIKLCYGDLSDKNSLSKAIKNSRMVIHLAAVTSETNSDYTTSRRINVEGTKNLLEICKERNIKRFLTLSSESTKRKLKGVYAKTKSEADQLIRNFGVPYTILRPSLVYGAGSRGLFQKTLEYIETLPLVPIIGAGKEKIIPIHVDDVTDAIIASMDSKKTLNKEYDLTGKDQLTFNQFIDDILKESSIKKKKIHIPFHLVYLGTTVLSWFMKSPPITKDNLIGLKQEISMSYKDAAHDFGFSPMGFKEGLQQTLYAPQSNDGRKRIAVVGMGKMGLLHASIINQIPNANLVAVCDANPQMKKQVKGMGMNIPFFISDDLMLKKVRLDAVFLCTPPYLNLILAKKFIDKNISVFAEKPLSTSFADAEEMALVSGKKGITTSCGYMVAYNPVFQKIKQLIDNKKFGKILSFESFCYVSQVFKKKMPKSAWQYDPSKTGGGVLITMAGHLIFLLNMYFGKCVSVNGTTKSFYTQMDDEVIASLAFKNGIKGKLKASWSVKGYEELTFGIKITAQKAVIEATNKLITITDKKSGSSKEIHISDIKDNSLFEIGGKGYYAQDSDFIHCLGTKRETLTNWKSSASVQSIIEAIYKSSGTKMEEKVMSL